MPTNRAPTKTWTAREGELYIARYPNVQFAAEITLSGVFGSTASGVAISSAVKNITVTPPETPWEKQDLLGTDSNKFQNQVLDEKPVGLATLTATMVLGEDEGVSDYALSGTNASAPAGYTRYQIGDDSTSKNKLTVCTSLLSNDEGNYIAFGFQDARMTKWGDVRISGPDSHWEQDITVICLAKNFYWEFKN